MSARFATTSTRSSRFGAVFMILFGSVFAGMGLMSLLGVLRQGNQDGPVWIAYGGTGLFIVVGLGIMGGGLYAFSRAGQEGKLARQYPTEPWLHNKTWASGRIKDGNLGGTLFLLGFAVFWNLISWGVTGGLLSSGELGREPATYLVLLFPLIGVGMAAAAIYQLLRWRKYGTSVFELAEVPGVIGGNLGGLILTKVNIRPEDGFTLTLRSIHQWTSGSGKNRTTHRETLWESEQVLDREAMPEDLSRSALPVLFFIPYSCKPTERLSSSSQNYWELIATAKTPGLDYKATFRVPVFITPESDPDARPPEPDKAAPGDARPAPLPALTAIPGLSVRRDFSGGEVLEFRPLRNFFTLLIPLFIGLGMLVGSYFAWNSDMPKIFPVFIALFGLLITYGIASSLLSRVRVTSFPDRLEIHVRRLRPSLLKTIPRDQIADIEIKQAMSSGNTVYYNIHLHTTDGQKVTIPTLIKGRREAESFVARLNEVAPRRR
ncbi:MAG: hypothetical protein Q7Q73_08125 [Verrucomicrobiota bacterium JB024]|nr:hypothetical protein [Verrucomicrobiota bacterium JB024]